MSIEADIEAALFARAASLVLVPAMPVAWPNLVFTPPPAGYLEVQHIPNGTRRVYTGSGSPQQRLGMLQIDVFKALNTGPTVATDAAAAVAAHFPTDLKMRSGAAVVRVQRAPELSSARREDPYWQVPVTIYYELFA